MPLLEVRGLSKTYTEVDAPLAVLRDLDFTLERGDMVGIVGDSGAGKSTLLYLLGALERPTAGEVLFDGQPVFRGANADAKLSAFRNRKIGFVFQFHGLIPDFNAVENTMMPALIAGMKPVEATSRAVKILGEVGLGARLRHKPGELSGGEQQRVAFARAMVMQPEIILADEPTGNLDAGTGEKLWELMFEINQRHRISFVVVTHNERLAGRLPRLYRLIDGKLEMLR